MTDLFVARGERLAARKVAGEMIVLSAEDSSLYVLNGAGLQVWLAADGRRTLSAIVDEVICREYEIDRETAIRDLEAFVTALAGHGILRTSGQAIVGEGGTPDASIAREV
jgi:hypothetical protein